MNKKALLALATVITIASAAFAETVSYAEGSYTIPDYMIEVPANDVRGYGPNPQGRSFMAWDSNKHLFLSVTSYLDNSQIGDERTWAAVASAPEEQLIQGMQASFAGGPAANKATAESVKTDLGAHKIISIATINDSGTIWKLVTGVLILNNRKSLHLEIYVDKGRFEELLPEMNRIVDSLSANPDFQLR